MRIKLKPCPECGSNFVGVHKHILNRRHSIICLSCKHLGPKFFDEQTATKAWNELPREEKE